jgi:penicillin-binding protein 1A
MGARPKPSRAQPPRRRRSPWRHFWRFAWLYALGVGSLTGVVVAASIHMPQVEALADFNPGLITHLYDRQGEVYKDYAVENRFLLREHEIPQLLRDAVVAVEDERFYQHGGIDLHAILRTARTNLSTGTRGQGASTLTMQLARNLFLTREKTWNRKISEALLAVEIEKRYSKDQILTLYCNLVYMGEGMYGMEAAARHYFNRSVHELRLAETATLAGLPQRPVAYSPFTNPELALRRRDHVIRRMGATGVITREQIEEALAEPLLVAKSRPQPADSGAYFAEEVRRHLERRYGARRLYEDGLQVHTTMDPQIQHATEEALRRGLEVLDRRRGWRGPTLNLGEDRLAERRLPSWERDGELRDGRWYEGIVLSADANRAEVVIADRRFALSREGIAWTRKNRITEVLRMGDVAWFRLEGAEEEEPRIFLEQEPALEAAAVVLEAGSGAVRALVGGWDFDRSKFIRITQARRQVGSAFKPFVYGAALEHGFTPADTLFDAPVAFMGGDARLSYSPRNYDRSYSGILTLRRAMERSINVPAVKLMDLVGIERVIDFARRAGIESDLPPYPSLALGSADLVPLELAAAYSVFQNQGLYIEPYLVQQVTTPDGRQLEEHYPQARKATDPQVAYVMTHMLQGVVQRGTAARLAPLGVQLAGKTGTTNDYTDAWFVGYTPRHTILVWVGFDQKRTLGRGMSGGVAALPIWKEIAEAGLEDGWLDANERFTPPAGVTFVDVELYTGLLAPAGGGARTVREAFVTGTEPTRTWTPFAADVSALPWWQQQSFYIPKEGERMPGSRDGG